MFKMSIAFRYSVGTLKIATTIKTLTNINFNTGTTSISNFLTLILTYKNDRPNNLVQLTQI